MIFTERKITVRKGKSCIDEPVILYRGDYEVLIKFTIMEYKFRFKSGVNLVDSEKASFGQLAILTPYGGNVFSEIVECEDGAVTFTLTKEMIDQLEEVGLYSFQIRLFDHNRESRVSIPPVEFGIEVREPVASEDHDNKVNNAIVGYSIAKVVDALNENVPDAFDDDGQYNKTDWETGDRITEGKLNKIEEAIDRINQNEMADINALGKRVTNNYNVLNTVKLDKNEVNSKIWSMANMGQDVKEAMTGGSVAVVGKNAILAENIADRQVTNKKMADNSVDGRVINTDVYKYSTSFAKISYTKVNGFSGSPYMLLTIPNYFKNELVAGDIITVECKVKASIDGLPARVDSLGIATTNYSDGSDYGLNTIRNFITGSSQSISKYTSSIKQERQVTNDFAVENSDYIIIAISSENPISFGEMIVDSISIALNNEFPIDVEILHAGGFKDGVNINVKEVNYGQGVKNVTQGERIKISEGIAYNVNKYVQFNLKPTGNYHNYGMIIIPNILGNLKVNDTVSLSFKTTGISTNVTHIACAVGTSLYDDGRDFYREVDNFTGTGSAAIELASGEINECYRDITLNSISNSFMPYLLLAFRVNNAINEEMSFLVGDIAVSLNGGSMIPVNEILYADLYMSDFEERLTNASAIIGEGIGCVLTKKHGISAEDINDQSISVDKIDKLCIRPYYKFDINISIVTAYRAWVLATIMDDDIVIKDGYISFKWKITSDVLTIGPINEWCFGYTEYLDNTEFKGFIPGYAAFTSSALTYDGEYLRGKLPADLLPEKIEGKNHLCIGFRVSYIVNGELAPVSDAHLICENASDSLNKFSFIDAFQNVATSTYTKEMIANTKILTNDNFEEIIGLSTTYEARGKYISILGDSISTYQGWIPSENAVWYTGSTSDVTDVTQTWWHQAISELGAKLCVNNSWSGSRVTTTINETSAGCMTRCQSLHTDEHDPDVIIVYLGINDFNANVGIGTYDGTNIVPTSTTTFREAYAVMLDKILTRYQDARVYVCTLPYCDRNTDDNAFPEKNQNGVPLWKYNDAIRELADVFGVEIIELSKCGITFHNRKKYLTDELHPLQIGMDLITRKVVNTIKDL